MTSIFGCAAQEKRAEEPPPAPEEQGVVVPVPQGQANLYVYSRMALKDLDEMNNLVQSKIRESRSSKGDKIRPLREAMQAVYSRPNSDFMIDKVVSPLRNELDEHDARDAAVKSLVQEAVQGLQKPEKMKPAAQVTYAVMLENFIAEMKPSVDEKFANAQLVFIRDANIKITEKANRERRLGIMRPGRSPSELAGEILKDHDQKRAKEK